MFTVQPFQAIPSQLGSTWIDSNYAHRHHRTTQVWSLIFPFTRLRYDRYVRMLAMGVSPRVALCRTVSTASCPSHKQQLLVLLARPLCGWPTLWTEHRPCAVTRHPLMEQAFLNTSLLLQAHWGPCHDVITKVHMVYTIKISVFALARSCKHFGWPSAGSVLSDAELQLKGKILLKLKLLEWALSNHTSMSSRAWSPLCAAMGHRYAN